jgi:L-iditol 2-dehydrogenase
VTVSSVKEDTVRVAVITGPGTVEIREQPQPTPEPDEVVVAVGACGLCTLERRLFSGEKRLYPVAPGHEVAGHVVAAGSAVQDLPGAPSVGDLVTVDFLTRCGACSACRRGRTAMCKQPQGGALSDGTITMGGGLTDMVKVLAAQAWVCGDAPLDHAAMGEPLACVAHSVRLSGFRAGDRVAIVGAGYMGRLHLAVTRALGAASVGAVDVSPTRCEDARQANASWVAQPDEALARGGKQDVVFVTAGAPGAVELAVSLCDAGGTVVLYGAFPKDHRARIDPDDLHHREVSIIGVYSHEPEDWRHACGWIRSGAIAKDLDALVTARFGLDAVAEALALAARSPVYRVLVGG